MPRTKASNFKDVKGNTPGECIERLKSSISGAMELLNGLDNQAITLKEKRDLLNNDIATWAKNIHKYEQEIKDAQ